MDPKKCKETVYPKEQWGIFHGYQCTRNIWRDGYCRQHHPDTKTARDEARRKAWDEKWEQRKANDPNRKLAEAQEEIVKLKARITELEAQK